MKLADLSTKVGRFKETDVQRFFARLEEKADGPLVNGSRCIEWRGYTNEKGYGRIAMKGVGHIYCHRLMYELSHRRQLRFEDVVMHVCDNRLCVNPDHLDLGTVLMNNQDRASKGRSAASKRGGGFRLTEEKVAHIKMLLGEGLVTPGQIYRNFGITHRQLWGIRNGRSWAHVKYNDRDQAMLALWD